MSSHELKKNNKKETTKRTARMTDNDVRRALANDHFDVNDFMALISPAAEPYLLREYWAHFLFSVYYVPDRILKY